MTRAFTTRAAVRVSAFLTIALSAVLLPLHASAQADAVESETGGIHLGPLDLAPRIGWQTEYDDNVFRDPVAPISDIVSTFSARTTFRGQMRRVALNGSGTGDWVHYASLQSERGGNLGTTVKVDFMFNRLVPYVIASYDNSRVRVNPEIDLRPRIEQSSAGVGGILNIGGKTSLDFSARRGTVAFDRTNVNGVSLRRALDRSSDQFALALVQAVTPLTRIIVSAEQQQDRFTDAPFRGADNLRVMAGFESGGRLSGRVRAGMRVNRPHDARLPESRGFLVGVGTTLTVRDRLQIGIDANRDLAPSYRTDIAYYESFSYSGSISYAIGRAVRIHGQAGERIADYRNGTGVDAVLDLAGLEREVRYASGLSYLLGESLSIDLMGSYSERTSPADLRHFEGKIFRAGISHAF